MNRIKELRENAGLSLKGLQDGLLKKCNLKIGRASLNNYERGEQTPKLETWEALADFFDVSPAYIMGISDFKDKDVIPLDEFISDILNNGNSLKQEEFLCAYKNKDGTQYYYKDSAKSVIDFFDLNRIIQTEYLLNTQKNNGVTSLGNTPLFYCGKELSQEERIKIMMILDILFDIDREKYNKENNIHPN